MKTITAVSTGLVNAGISIIRVSGSNAFKIADEISTIDIMKQKPNTIKYGKIIKGKKIIDEVVIMKYKAPRSFTGENLIEINCHGGIVITNMILNIILNKGAILAMPGEFSQRAFINGKISFFKAEAINDIIHSKTERQATIASKSLVSNPIKGIRNELLELIAQIEVNIDYPEYDDVMQLTNKNINIKIKNLITQCNSVLKNSKEAVLVNEGIKVAIIGEPNAGKSSLINMLTGTDKAIVDSVPGTTRDIIECSILIKGIPFTFFDMAGIRKSRDVVENIGISKAFMKIKESDIVLRLTEPGKEKLTIDHKNIIDVSTKSDIKRGEGISISIKNNDVSELLKWLENEVTSHNFNISESYLTNKRQKSLLEDALEKLNVALEQAESGATIDLISLDLYDTMKSLNEILGKEFKDGLLNEMFSKFCLGK